MTRKEYDRDERGKFKTMGSAQACRTGPKIGKKRGKYLACTKTPRTKLWATPIQCYRHNGRTVWS